MKTCSLCGRDDLKHQGALNIHMYHCKMKNGSKTPDVKTVEVHEKSRIVETCKHEYRLLNLNAAIERAAYNTGVFKEVCKTCQELR